MHVSNRRQPRLHQVGRECRPVDATLAVAKRPAIERVRHTCTAAVGVDHFVEGTGDADDHAGERRDMCGIVRIDQHPDVLSGQLVRTLFGRQASVIDGHHSRHRLLLEPLVGVALRDARGGGKVGRAR